MPVCLLNLDTDLSALRVDMVFFLSYRFSCVWRCFFGVGVFKLKLYGWMAVVGLMIDYHIHALSHGEYSYSIDWLRQFMAQAKNSQIIQIGFCEHEYCLASMNFSTVREAQAGEFQSLRVRLGVEIDYKPEREKEISRLIESRSFDYVIGSVHHIGDWLFDHPDYKDGFEGKDIDEVYNEYYGLVAKAISSGLFDIVGHLDLVKIWGHRPQRNSEEAYIEPLLKIMKRYGVVVEVNSAGLRKPVEEIYPSFRLLKRLYEAGIPVTFGSDAHRPEEVGLGLKEAFACARQAGYRIMVGFNRRRKILNPMTY